MKKEQKKQLNKLHVELVRLQKQVIGSGLKLLVILEGRDAAGKDGMVKCITRHLSPRETRVVALGKPSDRQVSEWYFQRYVPHLPAAGEFVIFNRSWYNRAGVETVMGFCTEKEYHGFLNDVELFEQMLVNSGIILLKYYLDISMKEQEKRLQDRRRDPLKQWKVSPIDEKAQKYWDAYSKARDRMLQKTNFAFAPWHIADANGKNKVRIGLIAHLLNHTLHNGKSEDLLRQYNELIYPPTMENIKMRAYK